MSLGTGDVGGERRAAEGAQVEVDDHVPPDAEPLGHPPRRLELDRVPLAVAKLSACTSKPSSRAMAAAVVESIPPLSRTTALGCDMRES